MLRSVLHTAQAYNRYKISVQYASSSTDSPVPGRQAVCRLPIMLDDECCCAEGYSDAQFVFPSRSGMSVHTSRAQCLEHTLGIGSLARDIADVPVAREGAREGRELSFHGAG